MTHPRPRPRRMGTPAPRVVETLNVDYTTVLEQAVDNERWRVLRAVRAALGSIKTTEQQPHSYSSRDRSAENYKRDLESALDRVEREGRQHD